MSPTLDLFGVVHLDRPSKVRDELEPFAADADAICLESPELPPTGRTYLQCGLRAPALLLGVFATSLLQLPPFVLLNRETGTVLSTEARVVDAIRAERGVPVHAVDDHPLSIAARAGWTWWLPNWGLLAAIGYLDPRALGTTVAVVLTPWLVLGLARRYAGRFGTVLCVVLPWPALVVGVWTGWLNVFVLVAVEAAFVATVYATLSHRNEHMLEATASHAAANAYDRVCLVTGRAHLRGLEPLADGAGLRVDRTHRSRFVRRVEPPDQAPVGGGPLEPIDRADEPRGRFSHPVPEASLEPAPAGERVGGVFVDSIVTLVLLVPVAAIVGVAAGGLGGVAWPVAAFLTWLGYPFVTEGLFGRTVGKSLAGLMVVGTDGARCTWSAAARRAILRPADFVVGYGIGFLVILLTERRQRLGDLAAGTIVVRSVDDDGAPRTRRIPDPAGPADRPVGGYKPDSAQRDGMTDVQETVEAEHETELSRLGSSKALYAITGGEMETEPVVAGLADRAATAAATFEGWTDGEHADLFAEAAEIARDHADRIGESADGRPTDEPTAADEALRSLAGADERLGGLLAWALLTDRTLSQAVGFFVGNADTRGADRFRAMREDVEALRAGAADRLEDADEDAATAAAAAVVEAAYDHYVETLEAMGIKVKPVC